MFKNIITIIGYLTFTYFMFALVFYILSVSIGTFGTKTVHESRIVSTRYFWECRKEVIVYNMFPFPDTIVVNKTDSDECEG